MFVCKRLTEWKIVVVDSGVGMSLQVKSRQKVIAYPALIFCLAGMFVFLAGCFDPSVMGRFRATPRTNIILGNLGVVDEDPEQFSGARDPEPKDLMPDETEYVIRSGDVVMISILDLFQSGQSWADRLLVSETGRITIPEIGTLQATGRTEQELTEDIEGILDPLIIKNPTVTVVVLLPTGKTFSIDGAIRTPSRYPLSQPNFRILEALAQAGGLAQMGVDFAYVMRTVEGEDKEASEPGSLDSSGFYRDEQTSGKLPPAPMAPSKKGPIESPAGQPERLPVPEVVPEEIPTPPMEEEIAPPAVERQETPSAAEEDVEAAEEDAELLESLLKPQLPDQPKESEKQAPATELTPEEERKSLLESIKPMSLMTFSVEMSGYEPVSYEANAETNNTFRMAVEEQLPADIAAESHSQQVDAEESGQIKPLKVVREGGRFRLVPSGDGLETAPIPPEAIERPRDVTSQKQPVQPPEPGKPMRKGSLAQVGQAGQYQEVIRIDLKALQNGDKTQNIIVRPGDYIRVQYNQIGMFTLAGQVARPGPYALQDRMTLKEAIYAAGGLSPLASPERCDITRRTGRDKEVTVRVDLRKLLEGTQPDYFVKAHDLINIGSHPVSRFVAVVRNSFRSTYGFGFVYDRNLADKDFGR